MDVWRYSDWDGFGAEVRESQPHIWRWRDWIVESLNRDMPYDRMIVAMLAADEAEPCDTGSLPRDRFSGPQLVQVQSQRLAGGRRRAHGQGVPGHHAQLRQVPRPQVRPDPPDRLLRLPRVLRAAHGSHRPLARPARHHQSRPGADLRRPAGHADLPVPAGRREAPGQGQAAGTLGAENPPAPGQARPDQSAAAAGRSVLPRLDFVRPR